MQKSSDLTVDSPPRRARRERDRELRRQDILAAAETIFAAHGYHEAAVEKIAEEAGYAAGTVYRYFESKKDLYQTLLAEKAGESLQRASEMAAGRGPVITRLLGVVRGELDFIRRHESFLRVLVAEVMSSSGDLTAECVKHRQSYLAIIRRLLKEGIRQQEFREMDVELTAVLIGRIGEVLYHEYLGAAAPGREFERRLARVEDFILETIDRLLLPT